MRTAVTAEERRERCPGPRFRAPHRTSPPRTRPGEGDTVGWVQAQDSVARDHALRSVAHEATLAFWGSAGARPRPESAQTTRGVRVGDPIGPERLGVRRPGPDPMDRRVGYPEPIRDQDRHRTIRSPSRGRLSTGYHPPLSPRVPVDGVPCAAGIDPERYSRHRADEPPMVFGGSSVSTPCGRLRSERPAFVRARLETARPVPNPAPPVPVDRSAFTANDRRRLGHQSKNPFRPSSLHAATRGNRGARRPSGTETRGERP